MPRFYHLLSCAVLLMLVPASPASATEEYSDVVLLDNGAVVQGRIVSDVTGAKLSIEREDGQIIEIPAKRIRLIAKVGDPRLDSLQTQIARARQRSQLKTAWARFLRVGYLSGESETVYGVAGGFGLLVERSLLIASGIGYESWQDHGRGAPIFVECAGYVWHGDAWPYWYFQGGILPFWVERGSGSEASLFFGFGAGVVIQAGPRFGVSGQLGFRSQSFVGANISLYSLSVGFHF